jgi:hypothetical protein
MQMQEHMRRSWEPAGKGGGQNMPCNPMELRSRHIESIYLGLDVVWQAITCQSTDNNLESFMKKKQSRIDGGQIRARLLSLRAHAPHK